MSRRFAFFTAFKFISKLAGGNNVNQKSRQLEHLTLFFIDVMFKLVLELLKFLYPASRRSYPFYPALQ